jgi:predicted ribosomally synthesized peptide with SipW-like signal peptide
MADDNDKSPLTRRRVLGGMATVGVAGAVGAGTWARFRDEETKEVTMSAGTLDLQVSDDNSTPLSVNIDDLANGEAVQDCETLSNAGTVAGRQLSFGLDITGQSENGRNEAEKDVDGSGGDPGELLQYLYIKGQVKCNGTEYDCFSTQASTSYTSLKQVANRSDPFVVDLNDELIDGANCEFCFTVWFKSDADGYSSDAMGDSVEFDINITLDQWSDSEYQSDDPMNTQSDSGSM